MTHEKNSMKQVRNFLIAATLCSFAAAGSRGAEIKLIANSSVEVSSVSADELRGVFLATKASLSDGSHVEPVLLKSGAAHEAFVNRYLGKTSSALEAYYWSLVFTGKGWMPKTLASDAQVIRYVAKTKGAIGYVSAGADTEGVKAIMVR
jgi:hypothetical protein